MGHGSVAKTEREVDRSRPRPVSAGVRRILELCPVFLVAGCDAPAAAFDDAETMVDASTSEASDDDASTSTSADTDEGSTGDASTREPDRFSCGDASVLLCADFDDPQAPMLGWAHWVTEAAANLHITDTMAVSTPASLEVRIDAADHLRVARAYRGIDVPRGILDITFAFRVSPSCFDGGAPVELAQVGIAGVDDSWAMQLVARPRRVVVREGATPHTLGSAVLDDTWHDIHVELDPIAGTIAVDLDDKRFVSDAMVALPSTPAHLTLELGPRREATERGACTMHVDDIFVVRRTDGP